LRLQLGDSQHRFLSGLGDVPDEYYIQQPIY